MSPSKLRVQLEAEGVKIRVDKHGILRASKTMTTAQRELITASKRGLIAVLTYQCLECNQPLRARIADGITWLECPRDPAHYGEMLGKLETIKCPGDECSEEIQLTDDQGWCSKHQMKITVHTQIGN